MNLQDFTRALSRAWLPSTETMYSTSCASFCFLSSVGFLPHKFLESVHGQGLGIFSRLRFCVAKRGEELLDFFLLVVGILPGDGERQLHGFRFFRLRRAASPFRLNFAGRGAEVALHRALLLLLHPFAEHFAIFRVHLRQIAVVEALAVIHFRATVAIALQHSIDSPFDFRRRTAFPPPKYCSYSIFSWRISLSSCPRSSSIVLAMECGPHDYYAK